MLHMIRPVELEGDLRVISLVVKDQKGGDLFIYLFIFTNNLHVCNSTEQYAGSLPRSKRNSAFSSWLSSYTWNQSDQSATTSSWTLLRFPTNPVHCLGYEMFAFKSLESLYLSPRSVCFQTKLASTVKPHVRLLLWNSCYVTNLVRRKVMFVLP